MTAEEAARRLGLSSRTVRRRIDCGKLRAVRDGGRIIVREEELAAYQREHQRPASRTAKEHAALQELLHEHYPHLREAR